MKRSSKGSFIKEDGRVWYEIKNANYMEDFFLSLPTSSNVWAFLWSKGGISAGRVNSNQAIFPYYTADKISDMKYVTGAFSCIKVKDKYWFPFNPTQNNPFSISMDESLYSIRFKEVNEELGLTYILTWTSSEKFGLVKEVKVSTNSPVKFELLEGVRNLMPSGTDEKFQNDNSTLLDAYKKTDLDLNTKLVSLSLSSIVTDKAEPSEALMANITFFSKLGKVYITEDPISEFLNGNLEEVETSRGTRGSAFLYKRISLTKDKEYKSYQVFDTSYDTAKFNNLKYKIENTSRTKLEKEIEKDIEKGRKKLERILLEADGEEKTNDKMVSFHHKANVLYNLMRGGTFLFDEIIVSDFLDYLSTRNKAIYEKNKEVFEGYKSLNYNKLREIFVKDEDTKRLFYEYIPLSFSRRHGDPSRPWNKFNIVLEDKNGKPILNYEGNWRDIFQNWESLSTSYPEYLEHMVSRFLDSMTIEGYNPYKINRDGIMWEKPEKDNPWAQIGYWNDHQVVYLDRLLKLLYSYKDSDFFTSLDEKRFSSANVPYIIKSYKEIEKDPHNTIIFDFKKDEEIESLVKEYGTDGRLVLKDNKVVLSSLLSKTLQIVISKMSSFVPSGGIWMNTQRPEWNDANNALAGYGLSIVSLAAVRAFIEFLVKIISENKKDNFILSEVQINTIKNMQTIYSTSLDFNSESRASFVRSLGANFENERNELYISGFGKDGEISKEELLSFLNLLLKHIDKTLEENKREDNLFHSYNVLEIKENEMNVENMKLQLEGQVATLSSSFVTPKDAINILSSLYQSPLYEEYTTAFTLYPDKYIPLFWEKNNVEGGEKFESVVDKNGEKILIRDEKDKLHFRSDIRNSKILTSLLNEENKELEELYEKTFKHHSFTGRSDSFFAYEGLGSVYWHMVSKLLLSVAELIYKEDDEEVRNELFIYYKRIRNSLGYKRTPSSYGSFPFMPYSHTPKKGGAKQPGMTGQVKEEILTRWLELGTIIKDGKLSIDPRMLEKSEFDSKGKLYFTRFGVPFTYILTNDYDIKLSVNNQEVKQVKELTKEETKDLLHRNGKIKSVDVYIPRRLLK